jgi:hypothetical protein
MCGVLYPLVLADLRTTIHGAAHSGLCFLRSTKKGISAQDLL